MMTKRNKTDHKRLNCLVHINYNQALKGEMFAISLVKLYDDKSNEWLLVMYNKDGKAERYEGDDLTQYC